MFEARQVQLNIDLTLTTDMIQVSSISLNIFRTHKTEIIAIIFALYQIVNVMIPSH